MRRIVTCVIFILVSVMALAQQDAIKGCVKDSDGNPVPGAIIKATSSSTILGYTTSDDKGGYSLSVERKGDVVVSVDCLGYESSSVILHKDTSGTCDFSLKEKRIGLKEAVVRAPAIRQLGDTLSYAVSAYTTRSDYTLKDALKRLPGIDVEESGRIKYLGKDISGFYIEGMNLLGGKYNIATSGIPAAYVNFVQVLSNHKEAAIDRNTFSDDVAINVKLNDKAKIKPVGSYEASAGYGDRWLYSAKGSAMLFRAKTQVIASLDVGNIKGFALDEGTDFLKSESDVTAVKRLAGGLSASHPPMKADRYISPSDMAVTVNAIHKVGKYSTIKGNAGYSSARSDYSYSFKGQYYDEGNEIVMSQTTSPRTKTQRPWLSLEYQKNSDKCFIREKLHGNMDFTRSAVPVELNGEMSSQSQSLNSMDFGSDFSARWRKDKLLWSVSSDMAYSASPSYSLNISSGDGGILQSVSGEVFSSENTVSAVWKKRHNRIYIPLIFNTQTDWLKTDRTGDGLTNEDNDLHVTKAALSFSPQYEYSLRDFVLRAEVPVRGDAIWRGGDMTEYFSVCPELYLNWRLSARSTVRTEVSYSRNIGDVLDFLTRPVQIDRTTLRMVPGMASDSKYLTANAHYDFKIPLSQWFVNADIAYVRNWRNLLPSVTVSGGSILNDRALVPNVSDNIIAQIGVTKQIAPIRTKVSLNGSYLHNEGRTMQNGQVMDFTGNSLVISPSVSSHPVGWLELNYSGDFSRTSSRYEGVAKSYDSRSHEMSIRVSPAQSLILSAATEITRKQLTDDVFKTKTLLDFGLVWKHKAWKLSLDLRNALDQRSYSYTLYDSINTFTYEYALRGREVVFAAVLTI